MNESDNVKRLPGKRSPSVIRFSRKVRLARGNICENCGATPSGCQIESHHVLEYHEYPEFGKDERNIIVLCQNCHMGLSDSHCDVPGSRLMRYALLKLELRERMASYVAEKVPHLTGFVHILRSGENAASKHFFRQLER